jgi:RHS repeat-associated protein
MGCLKLPYYDSENALEENPFFMERGLEKNGYAEKKRVDYYAFGSQMPQRSFTSTEYDYGFQGQEKDDEIAGNGNVYDLGLREYDARLGRMFSIDPRTSEYPWQSPYVYHRNSPISTVDYLGGGDKEYTLNTETGEQEEVSDIGGDDYNIYHYYGGGSEDLDGSSLIINLNTGAYSTISRNKAGESLLMDYTHRGDDTDYMDITKEFFSGRGPTNSLISGAGHQMNQDIVSSPIFQNSVNIFKQTDMKNKLFISNQGEYGAGGAAEAGENMTAQMLGKFGVSFYPVGDIVIVVVTDSKSNNSVNPFLKGVAWVTGDSEYGNEDRREGYRNEKRSTTHQTYLFSLPKSYFE